MKRAARRAVTWLIRIAVALGLIVVTALVVVAFVSRSMPDLQAWHHDRPEGEFRARDARPDFDFADYLSMEQELFAELPAYYVRQGTPEAAFDFNRYLERGMNNPQEFEPDWNRTTVLTPDEVRGGVLLLHGLSDSPYSLRALAEKFREAGFYTVCMRMPGHGTVPAGLLRTKWKDWVAAVRIGARHVKDHAGEGNPFYIGGYSNGGALAVYNALEALEESDQDLPRPDRLILFSPCIGVSAFAAASNWHRILSWMTYFEKSRWLSIEPEFDPYKYNSFPKNAGAQAWDMTQAVQERLDRLAEAGRLKELPPILSFQSVVDATVIMEELVSRLYDRLEPNGHELVLFDVNRGSRNQEFMRNDKTAYLAALEQRGDMPFRLTVVENDPDGSFGVTTRTREANSTVDVVEDLDTEWPPGVYSLAHVSIPFSPDDPLYGVFEGEPTRDSVHLGSMAPRGETGVLTVSPGQFLRLRHNPFYEYIERRVRAVVDVDAEAGN